MNRPTCRPYSKALLLAAALWPQTAAAHSALGVSRWWDGSLHVLMSPLAVAAVIALAVALARVRQDRAVLLVLVAAVAAFGGSALTPFPGAVFIAPLGAICAGGLAALALPLEGPWSVAAILVGVAAGVAAAPDENLTLEMAAGAAFAVLTIGANGQFVAARLARLEPVIPRVIGAWCAAIGLMMGLLALAQ